jgi:hypothetical protein
LFKTSLDQYTDVVNSSNNVLIFGDYNYKLEEGNKVGQIWRRQFGVNLLSPCQATWNFDHCIDGVFGKSLIKKLAVK